MRTHSLRTDHVLRTMNQIPTERILYNNGLVLDVYQRRRTTPRKHHHHYRRNDQQAHLIDTGSPKRSVSGRCNHHVPAKTRGMHIIKANTSLSLSPLLPLFLLPFGSPGVTYCMIGYIIFASIACDKRTEKKITLAQLLGGFIHMNGHFCML